jgi:hypothetical protein
LLVSVAESVRDKGVKSRPSESVEEASVVASEEEAPPLPPPCEDEEADMASDETDDGGERSVCEPLNGEDDASGLAREKGDRSTAGLLRVAIAVVVVAAAAADAAAAAAAAFFLAFLDRAVIAGVAVADAAVTTSTAPSDSKVVSRALPLPLTAAEDVDEEAIADRFAGEGATTVNDGPPSSSEPSPAGLGTGAATRDAAGPPPDEGPAMALMSCRSLLAVEDDAVGLREDVGRPVGWDRGDGTGRVARGAIVKDDDDDGVPVVDDDDGPPFDLRRLRVPTACAGEAGPVDCSPAVGVELAASLAPGSAMPADVVVEGGRRRRPLSWRTSSCATSRLRFSWARTPSQAQSRVPL